MMKEPSKATRENVFAACDTLFRAHERITMPAVRERLGGGSQESIHRYVREWEACHRERFLELERQALQPPSAEVPPELWQVLLPIWGSLVAAARAVGLAKAREAAQPPQASPGATTTRRTAERRKPG